MTAPVSVGRARRRARRWTVRLRLTVLYGALVLGSGAAVLAITYVLVDRATRDEPASVNIVESDERSGGGEPFDADDGLELPGPGVTVGGPVGDFVDQDELAVLGDRQHAVRMRELLTQSGIALGVMAVASVAVGWVVAGRVLRPLRTITASTRTITATNLHRRLDLVGPRDELTDLADTVDDLLARLDAAFEAQRRFIANASHELRTPLARQRTIGQVALDDPDATVASLRVAHERVLAAGRQQERLIDALLTLARGEAGLIETEPVELDALAARVVAGRADEIGNRSLHLLLELQAAPVDGDRHLLERIVANLVDNAINHNHPGGSIRVATGMRGPQSFLSVTNTGTVIPADSLGYLFEPFRRLDTRRAVRGDGDGVGLGLSIVKAIADVHGAAIHPEPHPHGRLTLDVTFPPREPAAPQPPSGNRPDARRTRAATAN